MKETECSRRFRLRELLLSFLQKQERMWMSLPSIMEPVIKDLTERSMNRETTTEDVQSTIRALAQSIQRKEESEMKKLMTGPGLSTDLIPDGNFELASPLTSEELYLVKVLETKSPGLMRSWRPVLAVITNDSFLHLFDFPSSVRVEAGSDVEVAFHGLVPSVVMPSDKDADSLKSVSEAPKVWGSHLKPAISIVLPNTKIHFDDDGVNTAFQLTETVFNQGAGKLFGKLSDKKTLFRASSSEDAKEWINALQSSK